MLCICNHRNLRDLEDELDAKENSRKTPKELYHTDRVAMGVIGLIALLSLLVISAMM